MISDKEKYEAAVELTKHLFEKERLPIRGMYEIAIKPQRTEKEQPIWDDFMDFLTSVVGNQRSFLDIFIDYKNVSQEKSDDSQAHAVSAYAVDVAWMPAEKAIRAYVNDRRKQLEDAGYKRRWF